MRLRRRLRLFAFALVGCVFGVLAALGGLSSNNHAGKPPTAPRSHALVNGRAVSKAEFGSRWSAMAYVHVALGGGSEEYCGGTMLSSTWVLTAAHCAADGARLRAASSFRVVTGRARLSASGGTTSSVVRVVVRPGFTTPEAGNDVALLRLSAPVSVTPLQLVGAGGDATTWGAGAGRRDDAATGPWTAGWGWTRDGDPDSAADTLRQLRLPIVDDATCAANVGANYHADSMLCAGSIDTSTDGSASNGRDTCQGDSGGPLVVGDGAGTWRIVGITSWGFACGGSQFGLYVRIAAYRDWIASIVGSDVVGSGLGTAVATRGVPTSAAPSGTARRRAPSVAVSHLRRAGSRKVRAVVQVHGVTARSAVVHLRLTSHGKVLYDGNVRGLHTRKGVATRSVTLKLRSPIAVRGRVGVRATLLQARRVRARTATTMTT